MPTDPANCVGCIVDFFFHILSKIKIFKTRHCMFTCKQCKVKLCCNIIGGHCSTADIWL